MKTAALALVLMAACGSGDSVHLSGAITFRHAPLLGSCTMVVTGASLTVRDGEGKVIGTADTEPMASPTMGFLPGLTGGPKECTGRAPFALDLPKADFYEVQIGKTTPLSPMSYDDLKAQEFALELDYRT